MSRDCNVGELLVPVTVIYCWRSENKPASIITIIVAVDFVASSAAGWRYYYTWLVVVHFFIIIYMISQLECIFIFYNNIHGTVRRRSRGSLGDDYIIIRDGSNLEGLHGDNPS